MSAVDGVLVTDVDAVVVDIEGTTSSTMFVYEHLYPYSRERFADWIARRDDDPVVARVVAQVGELIGVPDPSDAQVRQALDEWLDRDQKVTPLKVLQGEIWQEGFRRGELTSHFYPDALPALRRWRAQGLRLAVFSSGSLAAQAAWFGRTPEGDARSLFERNFDTENAGPKREKASYRSISKALAVPAARLVFISDLDAELDAAKAAGWQTIGIRRPGEQHADPQMKGHRQVASFDEITIAGTT
jgi:enolase-phosphatase E1